MTDRDFRALVAHLRDVADRLRAAEAAGDSRTTERLRRWERDVEGSIDLELGRVSNGKGGAA